MRIYSDKSLSDFEFWSGAVDTAEKLTTEELNMIEKILEEDYPGGITEGELNDLFWFEDDMVAQWLGYEDFEDLESHRL